MKKSDILHSLSLALVVLSTILAYGDRISSIPGIPPGFAHAWPFVFGLSALLNRFTLLLGDYLDDGKINGSFTGLIVGSILAGTALVTRAAARSWVALALVAGIAIVGLAGCASSPFDSVGVSGEYQNKDGERFGGGISGHLRDTHGLNK